MVSRTDYLLDASALLAVLLNEPGQEQVREVMHRARIHSLNAAEVLGKLVREGVPPLEAKEALEELSIYVDEDFSIEQAALVGELLGKTRKLGLSLGDCVCLAIAIWSGSTAVTADRSWSEVATHYEAGDLKVQLIR